MASKYNDMPWHKVPGTPAMKYANVGEQLIVAHHKIYIYTTWEKVERAASFRGVMYGKSNKPDRKAIKRQNRSTIMNGVRTNNKISAIGMFVRLVSEGVIMPPKRVVTDEIKSVCVEA